MSAEAGQKNLLTKESIFKEKSLHFRFNDNEICVQVPAEALLTEKSELKKKTVYFRLNNKIDVHVLVKAGHRNLLKKESELKKTKDFRFNNSNRVTLTEKNAFKDETQRNSLGSLIN